MPVDRSDLLQGTLNLLILKTLSEGPMHGFGIARRIKQTSNDVLRVEEGSLYPALHRMEQRGWIQSHWGASEKNRRAKYYKLTPAGRRQLRSESEAWHRLSWAINMIVTGKAQDA